jgi:voltage-gated potassium channel
VSPERDEAARLRDDPGRREDLRGRLDRYLDVPLALASVLMVLLAVIELSGEVGGPWRWRLAALGWSLWGLFFVEFAVKFALAPVKRAYLKRNRLDVLVLLVPFLRFLRFLKVLGVLRAARALPLFRLAVFGGRGSGGALTLLRRRRLGQLALVSVMVILLGAAAGLLLESGAPGATINGFGDALWWSGALVTTVGSEIYPVTTGGRVLGFVLMLYAVGIFSYFIASIASVLVGVDSQKPSDDAGPKGGTFRLDAQETATLRRILDRAGED